jgi:succinate-semialdehyde dehydrogenase/glutarate-semialdehyde dehydrogenase
MGQPASALDHHEPEKPRRPLDHLKTYAPATGELLGELPVTPDEEVRRVVARARKAQAAWAVLPVEERAHRLLRLRDALTERAEDLVEIVSRECGKPRHEALVHELMTLLHILTWYCKEAPAVLAPERIKLALMKHRGSEVHYTPRGVIGVISPGNYPLVIPMGTVVVALLSGNACVVKPSELTPLSLVLAKKTYDSTGLPEDLFGVVVGGGATGRSLVDAGIDYCVFTGAVATGREVAAACGARLIPCTMELGGKAPLIACEDCDLERTARAIVMGGFANSGQACVAVERVYAHERVYEPLLARVRELVGQLRQGDPSREYVDIGAVTSSRQLDVVGRQLDDALSRGARLVCGGSRPEAAGLQGGRFFEPTVLADCNHAMAVMREESFGPVVPFMPVSSDDEAVALANDSHLGLNAYVFTRDRGRARSLADRLEAGSVVINDVLSNYAAIEAPFGGVKNSGFGRVHGAEALRELSHLKHVSFDRVPPPARDLFWYPYTARSFRWLQRGVRLLFGGGGWARKIGELL